MTRMPGGLLARLAALDTCAVADALDSLRLTGVVPGLHAYGAARRICGRAITVRLEPLTPELARRQVASGAAPRHLGTAAVDASGPGDVILVSNGGGPDASGWGGILSLGATLRGVAGVLVDGGCRDVDEAVELDLPLYARNAVPQTARGRVVETSWNEPVPFGPIEAAPGDLVIADRSGVVVLTERRAAEIVDIAEGIADRERLIMDAVRRGAKLADAMASSYEDLLKGPGAS